MAEKVYAEAKLEHNENSSLPSTEPSLFEAQNMGSKSGFDPATAGEDKPDQRATNGYETLSGIGSSDRMGTAQSNPPGTPSKETLERLRAAVSKSPNNQIENCLEEYEAIDVWKINASRTQIAFVNAG